MTIEKAIEVLKSECYVFNPMNFDRTTLINTALDTVIETLEKRHDEEHHCCHRYYNAVLEDVKEDMKELFVDLQDGSEEWRSYVNGTVLDAFEIIDKHMKKEEQV